MNIPISITFTIADILWTCFYVLISAILVYLLLVLKEVYFILKSSKEFYNKNSDTIESLVKDSSVIIHKTSIIAENIPEEPLAFIDDLKNSFPMLQGIITLITNFLPGFKSKK